MLSAFASAVGWSRKPVHADAKPLARGRAPSECSTAAESDRSTDSGSEVSSPRDGKLYTQSDSVIIFDWDDTLLPTSLIRDLGSARPSRTGFSNLDAQLRAHAARVETVLRASRAVARVSIVTLAKRHWVPRSAEQYLPGLNLPALVRELGITVYYAQEESVNCPGALIAEDWTTLKRSAMARCLDDWRATGEFGGGSSPTLLSVLSVGDAVAEQQALQTLIEASAGVFANHRLACKTLKLMDRPSLELLGEELRLLPPLLPKIVAHDRDIDIAIDDPSELAAKTRTAGL